MLEAVSVDKSVARKIAKSSWLKRKVADRLKVVEEVNKVIGSAEIEVLILDGYYDWLCDGQLEDERELYSVMKMAVALDKRDKQWLGSGLGLAEDKLGRVFRHALALSNTISIEFVTACFLHLNSPVVRQLVAPLVSIPVWRSVSECYRDLLIEPVKKQWKGWHKRFNKSDSNAQGEMLFYADWLYESIVKMAKASSEFKQLFVKLLIVMLGQIPTRRYTNTLLKDLCITEVFQTVPELDNKLRFYINFPIDDLTGVAAGSYNEAYDQHAASLKHMQTTAYQHPKLKSLALANVSSISSSMLFDLGDEEKKQFLQSVGVRTEYPFLVNLDKAFDARFGLQVPRFTDIEIKLPTEELFDTKPVAVPQAPHHLSVGDLLIKLYEQLHSTMMSNASQHLNTTLQRVQPQANAKRKLEQKDTTLTLKSNSKYCAKIRGDPAIVRIIHPPVGSIHPKVIVEASLDPCGGFGLHKGDIVYLMQIERGVSKLRTATVIEFKHHVVKLEVDSRKFPAHQESNPEVSIMQSMNLLVKERHAQPPLSTILTKLQRLESDNLPEWINDAAIGASLPEFTPHPAEEDEQQQQHDQAIGSALNNKVCIIDAPPFTGSTTVVAQISQNLPGKTLIVTTRPQYVATALSHHLENPLDVVLCGSNSTPLDDYDEKNSEQTGTLAHAHQLRTDMLRKVDQIAKSRDICGAYSDSCESALLLLSDRQHHGIVDEKLEQGLKNLQFLDLLLPPHHAHAHLLKRAKVVVADYPIVGVDYDNLIIHHYEPAVAQVAVLSHLSHLIIVGNKHQGGIIRRFWQLSESSGQRIQLKHHFGVRSEVARLSGHEPTDSKKEEAADKIPDNAGFAFNVQIIDSEEDSVQVQPGLYQNQYQADYAVAIFKYMRLLNYPLWSVAIITTVAQKALIQQVLTTSKCQASPIFGTPLVLDIDECQYHHYDYVICSIPETTYLQTSQDMQKFMSTARYGFYAIGNTRLHNYHATLPQLPSGNLSVVTNELYGQKELGPRGKDGIEMQGLEHFEQYVNQMTESRMQYEISQGRIA